MDQRKCDVLVIGGGGAGMIAGVRAAEISGGDVIILEKAGYIGGGMLFASTMRTFRSRWQKERNIPDQTTKFIREMMDLTMWKLDPKTVSNAILGTGEFFDWYSEMETPENLAKYEPRPYVFDIPTGGQVGPQVDVFHKGSGEMFMKAMQKKAKELGVAVLTKAAAKDVIVDNGKITAVIADVNGEEVQIGCKICVIASGSWIQNKEIVEKVLPEFLEADVFPNAHQNPAYTGDAIAFAEKAGAFVDWESFCLRIMGPMCALGETSKFDSLTHAQEQVLVNLNAQRFVAEPMAPRIDPFDTGHILLQQPKAKSFFLFSKNTIDAMHDRTAAFGESPDTDPFGMDPIPPHEEVRGWFLEAQEKRPKDFAAADTVEELAGKLGLDPQALRETVSQYDASCAAGEDLLLCKEEAFLVPLGDGPYYGMTGYLSTDGAFGGVRVNPDCQVYAADGVHLIDGLYAAGDIASGRHIVMNRVKKQVLNDMSWAVSSGYRAGTQAGEAAKRLREA